MDIKNIKVLTHSSIRMEGQGLVIYIDPYNIEEDSHDADIILVTHDHFDHFSPEDIGRISNDDTVNVFPVAMEECVKESNINMESSYFIVPNTNAEIKGVVIEAIPSYNVGKDFHHKSKNYVGYIVNIEGDRVYVAGDTDVNEDNKKVVADIALVPVGGTYTMTAEEGASLVNEIRPRVAIPTHYGTLAGDKGDGEKFKALVNKDIEVIVQL